MKTAIIADDEQLARDLLRHLIEKYNLPVQIIGEASDGDEALTLLHALRPDIVFLDIEMPGHNGIEVMEKAQASYFGVIKFIIITAYSSFEYAQSSLRLGAKDILLKPVEPLQFLEMMERVMGHKYTNNQSFNDILEFVGDNFEKGISLESCATQFHISSNYITRLFKKYLGVGFVTYINGLKIKKAQELLRDTDYSIKEVAQKVGYNNLNYFYKSFNALIGVTPKAFKSGGGDSD